MRVKIKQISTTATDGMLFTVGLGKDGRVYLWNSEITDWVLHKSVPQAQQNQPNRSERRKKK